VRSVLILCEREDLLSLDQPLWCCTVADSCRWIAKDYVIPRAKPINTLQHVLPLNGGCKHSQETELHVGR